MINKIQFTADFSIPFFDLKKNLKQSSKMHIKNFDENFLIKGLSLDSRYISPGDIFIAINGKNFDGHKFLNNVKKNYAIGAIVEKNNPNYQIEELVDENFFLIEDDDPLDFLYNLSKYHRKKLSCKMISVTGSNGKTTSKDMIAKILVEGYEKGKTYSTFGNQNNHIGVPLNLLRIKENNSYSVIEVGMNHPGEIKYLSDLVRPEVALITNAQREHQEFMGSVEATAKENGSSILSISSKGFAVFPRDFNNENIWISYAKKMNSKIIRFGLKNDITKFTNLNLHAEIIGEIKRNIPLNLNVKINNNKNFDLELKGFGEQFARNALSAIAVGIALKIPIEKISNALKKFAPVKGRGDFHILKNGTVVVDDSYNANPDSMAAAILALKKFNCPRCIVLGDMGEMGDQSLESHKEIIELATSNLDKVFLYGKEFSRAFNKVNKGDLCISLLSLENKVTTWLNNESIKSETPTVWVKGSRFMLLDKIVSKLISSRNI